jgi:hypothetical protein
MTAGMEHQLQIRLQNPPWRYGGLVGDFEHSLVVAQSTAGTCQSNLVLVQTPGGIAYSAIARRNAQKVEFASRE